MTLRTQQNKHQLETDICIPIFYQSIFPAPSLFYYKTYNPRKGNCDSVPHTSSPSWLARECPQRHMASVSMQGSQERQGWTPSSAYSSIHPSVCLSVSYHLSIRLSVCPLSVCPSASIHLHTISYHLYLSIYRYLSILSSDSLSSMWRMLILYLKKETSSKENFKSKVQSLR